MKPPKERLPYEENAEQVTVEMWKCRGCGVIWHNEHAASYCCCGDRPCKTEGCDGRAGRGSTACEPCISKQRDATDTERFEAAKRVEWDGEFPLCDFRGDRYIFDETDLECYLEGCAEGGARDWEDVRLETCEPHDPPCFEIGEFLFDHLPEDCEVDDESACNEAINKIIKESAPKVFFGTGKVPTVDSLKKHLGEWPWNPDGSVKAEEVRS